MNQQLSYDNIVLSCCQQWILSCRCLTKDNFIILSSFQIRVKQISKQNASDYRGTKLYHKNVSLVNSSASALLRISHLPENSIKFSNRGINKPCLPTVMLKQQAKLKRQPQIARLPHFMLVALVPVIYPPTLLLLLAFKVNVSFHDLRSCESYKLPDFFSTEWGTWPQYEVV